MNITMNNHNLSIQEMAALLQTTANTTIIRKDTKEEIYQWIEDTVVQIQYFRLRKKEKRTVIAYLSVFSGYGEDHVQYLIRRQRKEGHLRLQKRTQHSFREKYTHDDIVLLAEVSDAYSHPNGHLLAKVCRQMRDVHGENPLLRENQGISGWIRCIRETETERKVSTT